MAQFSKFPQFSQLSLLLKFFWTIIRFVSCKAIIDIDNKIIIIPKIALKPIYFSLIKFNIILKNINIRIKINKAI